jgi:hypothetical protein
MSHMVSSAMGEVFGSSQTKARRKAAPIAQMKARAGVERAGGDDSGV